MGEPHSGLSLWLSQWRTGTTSPPVAAGPSTSTLARAPMATPSLQTTSSLLLFLSFKISLDRPKKQRVDDDMIFQQYLKKKNMFAVSKLFIAAAVPLIQDILG